MKKSIAVCLAVALWAVVAPVAFATGTPSNNCNGNSSCSQDTNVTNDNDASAIANGGSATAFGGSSVAYGGNGGSSHVDVDNDIRNTVSSTNVNVNDVDTSVRTSTSQGQEQGQIQGQNQSTRSSSDQTQSANNEGVHVDGDTTKVYSYAQGSLGAAVGTDGFNVGSPFLGGIGFSQTSRYAKTIAYLQELKWAHDNQLVTDAEFRTEYAKVLRRLRGMSSTNDRGLGNLFGLL